MSQKCSTQNPGGPGESRELVRFSTWLLACALLLQANSTYVRCQGHDQDDDQENTGAGATGSRTGQTPGHTIPLWISGF
jgi:hypothetical protein